MIEKTYPITEKLLANALKAAQSLFELLTIESDKLKQKIDPEAIANIAANKRELVAQLEQFTKQLVKSWPPNS